MKKYTQLVIIRYPASGETIAYRRDDPELIDTLIDLCNIEYDDTVLRAELEEDVFIEPRQNQTREIIESDENPRYDTSTWNGNHLRYYRKKYNISQKVLSNQIGISMTTISRWEQGHMGISKKSVVLLNDFFNKLYNQQLENENNEV